MLPLLKRGRPIAFVVAAFIAVGAPRNAAATPPDSSAVMSATGSRVAITLRPADVVPVLADGAMTCDEKCLWIRDENGGHLGYGCIAGTQGFDCYATTWQCTIEETGCGGGPGGEEAPFGLAMSKQWRNVLTPDGTALAVQLTCDPTLVRVLPALTVTVRSSAPTSAAAPDAP